jgi:hypothetical protein
MALLDFKNLIAPFNNTVHMVTIIAVVLLFVVFRLATGGIEFEDSTAAMKAITQPDSVSPERTQKLQQVVPTIPDTSTLPSNNDKDLQEIERALGLK